MKTVRSTSRVAFLVLAAIALLVVALSIAPRAQTQMAAPAPQAFGQLVEQIKRQQDLMVANQAKIDEQIATIKEEIRLVRIFSKRAGGGGGG